MICYHPERDSYLFLCYICFLKISQICCTLYIAMNPQQSDVSMYGPEQIRLLLSGYMCSDTNVVFVNIDYDEVADGSTIRIVDNAMNLSPRPLELHSVLKKRLQSADMYFIGLCCTCPHKYTIH